MKFSIDNHMTTINTNAKNTIEHKNEDYGIFHTRHIV